MAESMGVCCICRKPIGGKGQIAHVVSPAPGGPRFNDSLPLERRNDAENLIYVCKDTHGEVDDYPEEWPVTRLKQLQAAHHVALERVRRSEANWFNTLFHETNGGVIDEVLRDVCAGQQLSASTESLEKLRIFRNNLDIVVTPEIHRGRIDQLAQIVDALLFAFEQDGEHPRGQLGVKRIMFYSDNDISTIARRDEFWALYNQQEAACAEARRILAELSRDLPSLLHRIRPEATL
jgi:hypothetical protein